MTDQQKALDPNTSPEDLYDLTSWYPDEVLANAGLELLALEAPVMWQRIYGRAHVYKHTRIFAVEFRRLPWGAQLRVVILAGARLLDLLSGEDRRVAEACLRVLEAQLKARGCLRPETMQKMAADSDKIQNQYVNVFFRDAAVPDYSHALTQAGLAHGNVEDYWGGLYWLAYAKESASQTADIRGEAAR